MTGAGAPLARIRRATWTRYLGASVVALGADLGVFLLTLAAIGPAPASAAGYVSGILVHWLVSSRLVFADETAERGAARHRQKALFVASALVGLALTVGIVWAGTRAGLDPRLAKLAAIAVSFQATYLMRKKIVFRR